MSATFFVPGILRSYCGGRAELPLSAPSVRAALQELESSHPALYRNVCDETGRIRRHVNLFVNERHIRDLQGLETPLEAGDTLIVLPAVSGG